MAAPNPLHGVLVIDKPLGPTSHDVVARLRKMLGTRAVGHAGTLDPAATGVLVVAVGEATKLSPYLTAQNKEYRATVTLGTSTTTLDAEGEITATGSIPDDLAAELRAPSAVTGDRRLESAAPTLSRALAIELARREQTPPAFSAIKTGGRAAHELARRGQEVPLLPRSIAVNRIEVTETTATTIDLRLIVAKGYYVRALARDLGHTLGVPAHLSSLRRIASGSFTLDEAVLWSASREDLERALLPVERAAERVLPTSRLSEEGERRARYGQLLSEAHFEHPPAAGLSAWFGRAGDLVAVGRAAESGGFTVERGFGYATSSAST